MDTVQEGISGWTPREIPGILIGRCSTGNSGRIFKELRKKSLEKIQEKFLYIFQTFLKSFWKKPCK